MADRAANVAPGKLVSPYRKQNVRRPGAITSLDIDGPILRVVQSAPKGNRTAITRIELGQMDLEAKAERLDPVVLGAALAGALEDLRLRPAQVVMGVPRNVVLLRSLTLPQIENIRELASMVHMQVAKDLPFRAEEAVIDFSVRPLGPSQTSAEKATEEKENGTPSPAPSKVEVLVAAVRRETVDYYQKVAAAAKIKLVALGWLSQANARCLEACGTTGGDVVALISVRPSEVGIDIISGQTLLFSRGVPVQVPGNNPSDAAAPAAKTPDSTATDPSAFVGSLTIEVVRSLHSYAGTEAKAPVQRVVVAGATGLEQMVADTLGQRLQIAATVLQPGEPLELPTAGRNYAGGAMGAIGLALGVNDPEGLPFDFLNPKRPAVQRNTRRIRLLALSAAGAAVLIALFGLRTHLVNNRLKINQALQKELSDAEKKVPFYRKMQVQAAAVQGWAKDNRDWLEHWAHLSTVLPASEDLYVTSLSVSGQGNIHLAVQARSGETLAAMDKQLRAAGYEVKPIAISPGNDKNGYNFRSTVELIVPAKMKIDLAQERPPARPADDGSLDGKSKLKKGGHS